MAVDSIVLSQVETTTEMEDGQCDTLKAE